MAGDDAEWRRGSVEVRFRQADGGFVDSTLDRVPVELVVAGRPVREFRWYRGRQFYSGWYWSATTGGLVAYESRLELDRILLADFDSSVVGIAAQPFLLVGVDGERVRRHVPDLLLLHECGTVRVVDVKPCHRLRNPDVAAVFAWTERLVAARGWVFEVWSGAEEHLVANVRFLAGYRRGAVVCEQLLPVALDLAGSCATIGALEHALTGVASPLLVRPVVLRLVWSGRLVADLTRPLGRDTSIRVAGAPR
jgi:hypothetical protein